MKKFTVDEKLFDIFPDYCLGVVTARGVDNSAPESEIEELLCAETAAFAERYRDANVRELPNVKVYRDAFLKLGINPNKFMCSIEALAKRVQKSGVLPCINPIVDLGNALSVKYLLPLGAHDIDKMDDSGVAVRFSAEGDSFLPMGGDTAETVPAGEMVYVSGSTVKTRRWMWRQSEDGKIGSDTSTVFFPIDGFESVNGGDVLKARDELAALLRRLWGCEVISGWVSRTCPAFELEL